MQNTRVSQLGDPLQVGVQAGAWSKTVASQQVCICLEELLALDPDNPDLLYNLGLCYVDPGQLDRGIELLLRCLKLAPAARTPA